MKVDIESDSQPGMQARVKLHIDRCMFRFEMERYLDRVFYGQVQFSKYDLLMTFAPISIPIPVYAMTYKIKSKIVRASIALWCTCAAYMLHTYWYSHRIFMHWCATPGILQAYSRKQYICKFGIADSYSKQFDAIDRLYDARLRCKSEINSCN